ncbi:MAG: acyl CoA:acetate/3-ketoacid CoA transferase [Deltaproteobacteria bacterium]|nr:acyl CoA:acetate/3-ketoacid CoA transferase [Deltaproteobacteria bacterium]
MASKIMKAEEAVQLIKDEDTVSVCGIIGALVPEKVLTALEKIFLETGTPRHLTAVFPVAVGDVYGIGGADHLAHEGLIKRVIGGSYVTAPATSKPPKMVEIIYQNRVEGYNFPMGVLMDLHREIAAKRPGLITQVGLKTFVDPRVNGAKMNEKTKEDLIEVIQFRGKEYLFYKSFPIDAAIIRGTTADEQGNITMEHEGSFSIMLYLAMAAHNCGGKVIAQVKRITSRGNLNPQLVKVPGILVDAIVIDEEQKQATGITYDPAVSGEIKKPLGKMESVPLSIEKVAARRALLELRSGDIVNLGFGIPSLISPVAAEENLIGEITFTIEHGAVGGVPLSGLQFGAAVNPEAIIESGAQFDFLAGGGIDAASMAFAEVDGQGNVNVSRLNKFPHVLSGAGGFIDILHNVRRIIFCGTLTAGGIQAEISGGQLKIVQEGKVIKGVRQLQHRTFDAGFALEKGQKVIYVTERAVFQLQPEGLVLTEVAPGIDIQRDIAPVVQFELKKSAALKEMDARLFRPQPMGLKSLSSGE